MKARATNVSTAAALDPAASKASDATARQILIAAGRVFAENGYSGTTMDAVAREASVVKATIYAHYESKDRLFAAVIENDAERYCVPLLDAENVPADTRLALERFATALLDLLLSPENISMHRSVAIEAQRAPQLGRIFFTHGPERVLERLADFLARVMARGELREAPARLAAAQFVGLISADLQLRRLFGIDGRISKAERAAAVASGVDAFLRAYARVKTPLRGIR